MRVVLLRPAIGDYRGPALEALRDRLDGGLTVLAGEADFAPTSRTGIAVRSQLQLVSNHYLAGRRLLWQRGCWRAVTGADVAILELNPRMLSSWLMLLARRALKRPTLLWGHAWPRSGRGARTDALRGRMRRLADLVIVYTETERRELAELEPGVAVVAAPNALYRAAEIRPAELADPPPRSFVCVGRLVPLKKPDLLVRAFLEARPELPDDTTLTFVGEGPMRAGLEAAAAPAGDAVRFAGHVSGGARLRELFEPAIASVSPGAVGLSIVQSNSFGVPMIVARDEPHGPEIEAARDGKNAILVDSDSSRALADALVAAATARDRWFAMRARIAAECAERYSVEVMAERMMEAIVRVGARRV